MSPSPELRPSASRRIASTAAWLTASMLLGAVLPAAAQTTIADQLNKCSALTDNVERLACYDRAIDRAPAPAPTTAPFTAALPNAAQLTPNSASPAPALTTDPKADVRLTQSPSHSTYLERIWELTPQTRGNNFEFTPYAPNYLLPVYATNNTNARPSSPAYGPVEQFGGGLKPVEMKFQLSFKSRLASDLLWGNGDLWFGYTQTSFLQSYAHHISTPFRDTDYAPELIMNWRTDFNVFGLQARMIQFGLLHDSNGRDEPLSRSWNRVYLRAGLERDDFALYVRPWYRIPEHANSDDNQDITDYMGRIDIVGLWRAGRDEFTVTGRSAMRVSAGRGSLMGTWTHPLFNDPKRDNLRTYVSVFTGYGDSLIDYNHKQTTLGLGVTLGGF